MEKCRLPLKKVNKSHIQQVNWKEFNLKDRPIIIDHSVFSVYTNLYLCLTLQKLQKNCVVELR